MQGGLFIFFHLFACNLNLEKIILLSDNLWVSKIRR